MVCPNCGWKQSTGTKCQKCSSLFEYRSNAPPVDAGSQAEIQKPRVRFLDRYPHLHLRTAWRIFNWFTLVSSVIIVVLLLHKEDPPKAVFDPDSPKRVEEKLRISDAATAMGMPHELALNGPELNVFLQKSLDVGNSSAPGRPPEGLNDPTTKSVEEVKSQVKDVQVRLSDDLVTAYVVFDFHGKDMSLELSGHLSSANGYLRFDPVSGSIGSLPIPQSALQSAVGQMMARPENREQLRLPDNVSDVHIEGGQVVIAYK